MARMKMVLAAAVLYAAISPAQAEVRILASPGGQVGPFIELFDRVRASGERVVIDGPCLSACTLVLMNAPRRARFSRRALDRPPRAGLRRAGSLASGARRLSRAGAKLDQPPRRIDVAAVAAARS